jgi:hypothetical protein
VDKAAGVDKVESGRVEDAGKAERDGRRLDEGREEGLAPEPAEPEPGISQPDPRPHRPPAPPPLRLLDALRERLRYMHYSLRTEEAYVYWARGFIRWAGLRHPRDLGAGEVQDFLVMLANERRVAAATHRQANANPITLRSPFRAREPAFPCYHPSRLTPSFTAAATSAS